MSDQVTFVEGIRASYDGVCGFIRYVGVKYLTISISENTSMLVYRRNWPEIKLFKESEPNP